MQGQQKVLTKQQTIPAKAQKASYEVAYLIAQVKKPHTIGKSLNKPAAVAINLAMHRDKSARELESVPLSNGTIARRITDMAQDIKFQLVDRVKKGKYALQSDESGDILNSAQLLVFIRYSFDGKRKAVLLRTPERTRTGEDIFTKLRKMVLVCVGTGLERCWGKERTESESLTSGAVRKFHTLYYSQRISCKQNT